MTSEPYRFDVQAVALTVEFQHRVVALVGRTAHGVGHHDDPVAVIDGAEHGGQHAHVGLGSGHDQGVGATILQMPVELMSGEDSPTVVAHTRTDAAYEAAIVAEFEKHHQRFCKASLPAEIKIILILLPMNNKARLLERFDAKLKGMMA